MKNIKGLFKNEAVKKILLFFNENPNSIDTAKGISIWVGCDVDAAQKALDRLAKEQVLVSHETAFTKAYSYTNQRDITRKIEKYIENSL